MSQKTSVAALVMIAAPLGWWALAQDGHRLNNAGGADADFRGKLISVLVKGPANGAVLRNARVRQLGGRSFLVGESFQLPDEGPRAQVTYWLPFEDVQHLCEYKSDADVLKDLAAQKAAK